MPAAYFGTESLSAVKSTGTNTIASGGNCSLDQRNLLTDIVRFAGTKWFTRAPRAATRSPPSRAAS
jgi:hypothetical protein